MGGYIVIDRGLFKHWIWDKYGKEWIDLIQLANYEDKTRLYRNEVIVAKRGVVEMSISSLAARWGWSRHKTSDFLNLLEREKMITLKKEYKRTTIEIANYSKYQKNGTGTGQQNGQKRDRYGTADFDKENVENSIGAENGRNCNTENWDIKRTSDPTKRDTYPINQKKKEINKPITRARAREGNPDTDWFFSTVSPELSEAVNRWIAYKTERRQSYKPIGLNTLLRKIQEKAKTHGDSAVIEAIDEAIASQYQGIVWDKISRKQSNSYDMIRGWANE